MFFTDNKLQVVVLSSDKYAYVDVFNFLHLNKLYINNQAFHQFRRSNKYIGSIARDPLQNVPKVGCTLVQTSLNLNIIHSM